MKILVEAAEHSKEGAILAHIEVCIFLDDHESRNVCHQEMMILLVELVARIPMTGKQLTVHLPDNLNQKQ